MMMWLCILFSTALLAVATYGAMKWFGQYSLKRDEAERARLAEEWKRRAAERKARLEGTPYPGDARAHEVDAAPDLGGDAAGQDPPAR